MYKEFVLLDTNNNIEKKAHAIVKFNFDSNNYLVYSVEENEQNNQIFVSKLVLNSEGEIFIDDISIEEKGKLSNIVYNIVILLPTDYEKGNDFQSLINNLFNKFSVKLLNGLPDIENQQYYSNCSIAITSKILVDNAVRLYGEKLNVVNDKPSVDVPMWTSPSEVTEPIPVNESNISSVPESTIVSETVIPSILPSENVVENPVVTPNNSIIEQSVIVPEVDNSSVTINEPVTSSEPISTLETVVPIMPEVNSSSDAILPNPQAEKLAIVSDPSLGIGVAQPNVMQNKKAGFANTKYVVIGTICLVLAIAVIVTAYFLIKNIS